MKPATLAREEIQVMTKTNVLVVDDRPDGLLVLEAVLADKNYDLVKASSGREALNHALCLDFAVILLDVQMPELDGFETAKLLRENHRSKGTPIIFVTAINKEIRHINQGYESGAVDYVFKPFDPFILKSKVDVFVDLFNKNQQIQRQAALIQKIEVQEKERQLAELRQESLRHYTSLADAIPHIIVKIHPEGRVEYFNQRWYKYSGFKSDVDWQLVIHPQDRRKFLMFWRCLHRDHLYTSQIELRLRDSQDGIHRWHLIRAVAETKNGEITNWICTCTDIDDIKKGQEAYRILSTELNRSNKELEEFAYIASHDLKEPLNVVSSFVWLLEKRLQLKLEDKEKEYLKFIKQGINQAQTLIKGVLEYSLVAQKRSVEMVDLSSVLEEVFINLKFFIEKAAAKITYDPMPKIMINHSEMIQLFQNLVANALKYKSEKPLVIHISNYFKNDMWFFSIKDNGIGIDPQFKERIFDMFQRLHAPSEYSGTGIGLAICKKIVEHYGGKIWVESKVNEGATFYFSIKQHV